MISFIEVLQNQVLIADGAMGTMLQKYPILTQSQIDSEIHNEYLNLTNPDIVTNIHRAYLEAGSDIIETNSFGAVDFMLAEYGLADQAFDIAISAAKIARRIANEFSTSEKPRFVAGSIGPTSKLPSLGHITFDKMYAGYTLQIEALIKGGVDYLQMETCQDLLQVKCAVIAAQDIKKKLNANIPICVTITVEKNGNMLLGSDIPTAVNILESLGVDIIGFNCASGPDLMFDHVRTLNQNTKLPIAVLPNAGLPKNVDGLAVYDFAPQKFAELILELVEKFGVKIIGGCCGTTPEHIQALNEGLKKTTPYQKNLYRRISAVSSSYQVVELIQPTPPLIISERCNANGSRAFRDLLLENNWNSIVEMAQNETNNSAHVLDLSTAFVGRNEKKDMHEIIFRLNTSLHAPIMIDSTQVEVIEDSLKLIAGRPIINSINLEDGKQKLDTICSIAKRFGAVLVALTIDEEGMAKTAVKKFEVAKRIYDICTKEHGIPANSLIFDPLTFSLGSGDEESKNAGVETLNAIKLIKTEMPDVHIMLGVSNISYGLSPQARQVLNSVFLMEAIKHGLSMCIVHWQKLIPINTIDPEIFKLAQYIIYNISADDYQPLLEFIKRISEKEIIYKEEDQKNLSPEELLKEAIIKGKKIDLEKLLLEVLKKKDATTIVNEILLEAMKEVGEQFGKGLTQLPFVLQSAEAVKHAVNILTPYLKSNGKQKIKGVFVIATVKGDVHDIGKNLVDIILSNNGFTVINLGIKQPIESIISALQKHKPSALGLSGLLVKSTAIMRENLETLTKAGFTLPVICGGAALTKDFTETQLQAAYPNGKVYYAPDAFSTIKIMDDILSGVDLLPTQKSLNAPSKKTASVHIESLKKLFTFNIKKPAHVAITPPFWGKRLVSKEDLPIREIFAFINKKSLFHNQWSFKRGALEAKAYHEFLGSFVERIYLSWQKDIVEAELFTPQVVYGYFPCNRSGNDIIIYSSENNLTEKYRFSFPRNNKCLADYIQTTDQGVDFIALQCVSIGSSVADSCRTLFEQGNYINYFYLYGISVQFTEALAEFWHRQIRKELKIDDKDGERVEELFRRHYQGARFSLGYPLCPDLSQQRVFFDLLNPADIGVTLTESFEMVPEQSTTAFIFKKGD